MYCSECGNKLSSNDKYCSNCGKSVKKPKLDQKSNVNLEEDDIKENKGISVLSYIGPLVFITYLMAKNSKFATYHSIQGINLFILWVGYAVVSRLLLLIKVMEYSNRWYVMEVTPWYINLLIYLIGMGLIIISAMGINNVCKGKMSKLPIVGNICIIK